MKNCGELLEREIYRRKVVRKDLAEYLGIHPNNLSKYLHRSSFDVELLEKFCEYLNLDPAIFFTFRPNGVHSTMSVGSIHQDVVIGAAQVNLSAREAELMKLLIEEKDKRISNLEENILMLKRDIKLRDSLE
ncbi:MAG: helix-turn-helix domain-containing protein [Muribaculaceae bacterium]|nr:helix-turn-helix domain-containing protein [Muribaculaceae bacterium]